MPPHPPTGTSGRVVVITGGTSGIGRCAAEAFARLGWSVGLIARSAPALDATRAALDRIGARRTASAQADVADGEALERAAEALLHALGTPDVWVNCAGNGTYGRFLDTPAAEFDRVAAVTFLGTVNGTRAALRRMQPRGKGRILNVCSAVAVHGMPLLSAYSGAKHAVRGFDQAIRAELAQEGSAVVLTTLLPPAVNTPFFDHAPSYMGRPGRPIPPVYQPEMVAQAIVLAATGRPRGEFPLSFTTILFALAMRVSPALIGRAIRRLGYGGQIAASRAALDRYDPTLFAPSDRPAAIHGAHGEGARSRSVHVTLLTALRRRPKLRTEAAQEPPPILREDRA